MSTVLNAQSQKEILPPSPFRDRDFVLLWLGQLISNLGDAALLIAVPVTVYDVTHSRAALSLVTIAGALPTLLLGLFAGVFVDRWDRRRTMIVSDLARALAVLLMLGATGRHGVWLFYAASFLIATFSCFFSPARAATLKRILPQQQLMQGNALITSGVQITGLLGPALGGALLHWLHPSGVFLFDAATFLVSACCLLLLRVAPPEVPIIPRLFAGVWDDMRSGLAYVTGSSVLRGVLILLGIVMLGVGVSNTLEYAFVKDVWHASPQFPYLMTVYGAGMIVAGLLVSSPLKDIAPRRLLLAGFLVFTLGGFFWAAAPGFWVGGVALFVFGLGNMLLNLPLMTLFQTATLPEMMGRATSVISVVNRVALLIGGALTALLTTVPLRPLFAALAGVYLLCTLLVRPLLDRPARTRGGVLETIVTPDAGPARP